MKKIVTIIGDSLSMARPNEGIKLQDLYSYKLQCLLPDEYYVRNNARRANDVRIQMLPGNLTDDLLSSGSEVIVIQLGIVDCAPRLFSRRQLAVLKTLTGFNSVIAFPFKLYQKLLTKNRRFVTTIFKKTYVPHHLFKQHYSRLVEKLTAMPDTKQTVLINIADTSETNKAKSYHFEEHIQNYNATIAKICAAHKKCELIDLFQLSHEHDMILPDGIHLTITAHNLLSRLLHERIAGNEK